jgi:hypothetical protein
VSPDSPPTVTVTDTVAVMASSALYEAFLSEQLQSEERRKEAVEQRGIAVITTSGALVTLLFGLSAYVPKGARFAFSATARGLLTAAMVSFLLGCVLALATNVPLPYGRVRAESLDVIDLVREPEQQARRRILITRSRLLAGMQRLNEAKAKVLVAAMAAEVAGAVCVALTVANVLRHA